MQNDPVSEDADIFRAFAGEIAHLDNVEAWRVTQAWLHRQHPQYRHRYREASLAIWAEFRRARRIWLMTSTMPEHMKKSDASVGR
jgi:hypothetical protein